MIVLKRSDIQSNKGTPCYYLNREHILNTLREAACLPMCLVAAECLDQMADRYVYPGEPWTVDENGIDVYDLTDFEVALIRLADKEVQKTKA